MSQATQTIPQQELKTEEQEKLSRANTRLALVLGVVALFALASTFYFFIGATVTVPS